MMENFPHATLPDADQIKVAWKRNARFVKETPLLKNKTLDHICGAKLYFKCENFQKAGAFKYRGATNALFHLTQAEKEKGVCTHSSGNHAQALALAAKTHGVPAYIVMPSNAPSVKVNAVRDYGGLITFCQPTLQARETTLFSLQKQTGATFVHPYNDLQIITGQAGCFYEVLSEMSRQPDYVVVPVGGGGLLSGTLLTANNFSPATRVIGAEPEMANDAWKSLKANAFVPSENPVTIADGLKTSLGSITWPIIRDNVFDILTVSEEAIKEAMFWVWERMKLIIEPSAAVPLAAVMTNKEMFRETHTVILFSGGNIDLKKLPW